MVNEEFINHYLIQNIWYRIMEYSVFSLNLWKPPWINQWLRTKDVFFLLYGDIRTVAENWQSQVLFVLDSYPKIYSSNLGFGQSYTTKEEIEVYHAIYI